MAMIASPVLRDELLAYRQPPVATSRPAWDHLATLDGLRGFAALAVLVVHVFSEMHLQTASGHVPFDQIVPHVHLAVDFFFMLSGFVIAKAYERKLATSMSFYRFMSVRLMRLYPLILMGVALGTFSLAIRVVVTHSPSPGKFLAAVFSALVILPTTALLSVFPGELFPIDFPQWSLFFELVINVVYALIVRWLSTPKLIAICAISFALLCGVAASSDRLLDIGMGVRPIGPIPADFWCGLIRVTFPFFFGILLFKHRLRWRTGNVTSIVLAVLLFATLFAPVFRHSWIYEVVAVAAVFPVVLSIGATCQTCQTLNALFLFLGELSYPLYITHNPVTKIFINALNMLHIQLPGLVTYAICCLLAIIVAIGLLHCWDRPVRKLLSRRISSPGSREYPTLMQSISAE